MNINLVLYCSKISKRPGKAMKKPKAENNEFVKSQKSMRKIIFIFHTKNIWLLIKNCNRSYDSLDIASLMKFQNENKALKNLLFFSSGSN